MTQEHWEKYFEWIMRRLREDEHLIDRLRWAYPAIRYMCPDQDPVPELREKAVKVVLDTIGAIGHEDHYAYYWALVFAERRADTYIRIVLKEQGISTPQKEHT